MEAVVLVVDDDPANLMIAQKILGKEFRIAVVNSGKAVFKYLERNIPDLILLDINMPEMDGYEVIRILKAKKEYASIPVVFLTADRSAEAETKCFEEGAEDFVNKPFIAEVLLSRVRRIMELERYHSRLEDMVKKQSEMITMRTQRINDIQEQVIISMANLIESRDGSTGGHVKRTQHIVKILLERLREEGYFPEILNENYIQDLQKAAPLHDVGKIKIPDAILQKPGRLTEEEYNTMKKHTEYSGEIIRNIMEDIEEDDYIVLVADVARFHHERWDGTGYPDGLKGEEIPLSARIMAFADVFDALYEERCYKEPIRPVSNVLAIISEGSGTQFDPSITEVFCRMGEELSALD